MCRGHDPLFSGQSALPSLPIYHHCAALMPQFSNFRKKFNFKPCFGQNFSSQDANFPNFRSLDPSFFKENPLPRPYFWKPVWHIPTQKKVECPPPPRGLQLCILAPTKDTGVSAAWYGAQSHSHSLDHGCPSSIPICGGVPCSALCQSSAC